MKKYTYFMKTIESMVRGYQGCVNEAAKHSQVSAIINTIADKVTFAKAGNIQDLEDKNKELVNHAKLCYDSGFEDGYNEDFAKTVDNYEAIIESMKCCGNCKYCCELGKNYLPPVRCIGFDQWERKEK